MSVLSAGPRTLRPPASALLLLPLLLLAVRLRTSAPQAPTKGGIAAQMGGEWKDVPYKVHTQLHDDCLQGNVTAVRTQMEPHCPPASPCSSVYIVL